MRVAFISIMHPAFDKRVYQKEAISLSRAGYGVYHVCFPQKDYGAAVGCSSKIRIILLCPPGRYKSRVMKLMLMISHLILHRYDVLHCNEIDSWFAGFAIKLLYPKTQVIFDVHECYLDRFDDAGWGKKLGALMRKSLEGVMKILCWKTDYLVFAKEGAAEDFSGIRSVPKAVVRNYVSLDLAGRLPAGNSESALLDLAEGTTCVHSGLISVARGWPQILDAYADLKQRGIEANLLFIGAVNDGSGEKLQESVMRLGLVRRFRMMEWVDFRKAFDFLLLSDIGLVLLQPGYTNHIHAFPHKMFDYMLAGLPIIVPSFAKEIVPIVLEAHCGYAVDVSKPREIADALETLIADQELRKRMGANGRAAIMNKYNWETEEKRLLQVYSGLITKASRL